MDNKEYWTQRNEQMYLNGEKKGLDVAKGLKYNYEQCLARIEKELNAFYGKYAKENKISLEDAKKFINKDELKQFKRDLNEYIEYAKKNNFRNVDRGNLKSIKGKARISRLEELKTRIGFEMSKLSAESVEEFDDYLANTYQDTFYKTVFNAEKDIGYKINFNKPNTKAIRTAIEKDYNGVSFADGLYRGRDNLNIILNQYIPQGIALGYNPAKMADIVSKQMNTNYNSTVRLLRTEYNAILNEASIDGYKAAGIEQYQILATLDSRTSDICQEMDGNIFNLKDKEVGINFPPFHPNCRTTTIPYFEPDEIDEEFGIGSRLAKDEKGNYYEVPANMTYKDWKAEQVQYTKTKELEPKSERTYEDAEIMNQKIINFHNKMLATGKLKGINVFKMGPNGIVAGNIVNEELGYDALPQKVSAEEFERLAAESKYGILLRGVTAETQRQADLYAEAFKSGELFAGRGVYGNGTYFVFGEGSHKLSSDYAKSKGHGAIIEAIISPDAKIIDFNTLTKQIYPEVFKNTYNTILQDVGYLASVLGYDAIWDNLNYLVVLNRGKVVIKDEKK